MKTTRSEFIGGYAIRTSNILVWTNTPRRRSIIPLHDKKPLEERVYDEMNRLMEQIQSR